MTGGGGAATPLSRRSAMNRAIVYSLTVCMMSPVGDDTPISVSRLFKSLMELMIGVAVRNHLDVALMASAMEYRLDLREASRCASSQMRRVHSTMLRYCGDMRAAS